MNTKTFRTLAFATLVGVSTSLIAHAQAHTKLSASALVKYRTAMQVSAKSVGEREQAVRALGHPFSLDNGRILARTLLELSRPEDTTLVIAKGGTIRHRFGTIVSAMIPVDAIDAVCTEPRIRRVQFASLLRPSLNESVKEIRADKVHKGEGLPAPYTGKGVIVGVFDTGIDIAHPDFRTESGSRILSLWDMSDNSGTPPAGFSWGKEYTKTQLDVGASVVAEVDHVGHGTHVAGTAAGNGRGNADYVGVAPDADLIVVKGVRSDANDNFSDDDIVAGCQYIFQRATALGKQAVINLSLGGIVGPHDGSELMVQALNALVEPGHIIVAAAGNEGGMPIHAGGAITATTSLEALINPINVCYLFEGYCPPDPNYYMTAADVWYTTGSVDTLLIGVYTQESSGMKLATVVPFPIGVDVLEQEVTLDGTTIGYISAITSTRSLPNGAGNILVQISNKGRTDVSVEDQLWGLSFRGAADGRVDLWAGVPIPDNFAIIGSLGATIYGNSEITIGSPATGVNMISVGSYITKNEWTSLVGPQSEPGTTLTALSGFSSRGPTRDGRMAPIIAAPGEVIFSAMTSAWKPGEAQYDSTHIIPGGLYTGMSGTSMATPHVVGVIALMMEAMPNLTLERIKQVFDRTARHDNNNPEDNNEMGYGKIDALSACELVTTAIAEVQSGAPLHVYPNPAGERVSISASRPYTTIEIVNTMGHVVMSTTMSTTGLGPWSISTTSLPTGRYMVRCISALSSETIPLTIVH